MQIIYVCLWPTACGVVESCQRVCDLPDHARIQGVVTACVDSSVQEGRLGSTNAARRACWPQHGPHLAVATQPAPPVRPCLPQSSLASTFEAALCQQHGTCGLCSLPVWHPGHGRHAKRRLRPPPCCGWRVIGFEVRCSVCVQVFDLGMYVCGVVCLCVLWCAAASP